MNQPDDQWVENEPQQWTWLDGSSPWGEDTQRCTTQQLRPLQEKCRKLTANQLPRGKR